MSRRTVVSMPGDGIGQTVLPEAIRVLDAVGFEADYVHGDIGWDGAGDAYGWLDDLAALRQSQGLRVKVVDVQDIYDEFSYGMVTPQAIKDFLTYAYENWAAPAPQLGEQAARRLGRALQAARSVRAEALAEAGWKGPELGQRLRRQRLEAIMKTTDS